MDISPQKAPREFDSIRSVEAYFDKHPEKLVQYIATATYWNTAIPGVHLAQLAKLMNIPFNIKGERAIIPPHVWVLPKTFTNFSTVLSLARMDYPFHSLR